MPTVNKGENKNDYMARCVPIVIKEGNTSEQAVGKCNGMWEQAQKLQIDQVEIKGVEIAYPGKFSAKTGKVILTKKDLDEMVKHFEAGLYPPYLNIDHDDKLTNKVKEKHNVLRLGTISKLYKTGERLIADFKEVPKQIAEFINKGLMSLRSIEFSLKHPGANGEFYRNVLKGVSFFGTGVPAIPSLADIPVLYKSNEQQDVVMYLEKQSKEVVKMATIDIEKSEYEELLKSKVQVEKLEMDSISKDEANELLKTELGTVKEENTELQKGKDEVEKMKADIDKGKEVDLKLKAEEYVDKLIEDKKLLPKFKDAKVKEYIRLETEKDEDGMKLFKEELESRNEVVNLTQITTDKSKLNQDGSINFKAPSHDTMEEVEANTEKDDKDADEAVKTQMKLKGYFGEDGYIKAAVELGILDKSEGGAE